VDRGPDREPIGERRDHVGGSPGRTDRAAQRNVGIERGGCHPDAGGRCRKAPFGKANVGPTREQGLSVPDRDRLFECERRVAAQQRRISLRRRTAGHGRQAKQGLALGRDQSGQACAGRFDHAFATFDFIGRGATMADRLAREASPASCLAITLRRTSA
jgi:hypothetical protein